jgi:hypothetical protein
MNKGRLQQSEKDYIKNHCLTDSDSAIAEHLDRDERTVQKYRSKTLGIVKKGRGQISEIVSTGSEGKKIKLAMTEIEKQQFFQTQLQNSLYYKNICEQFSKDEINFYLEEWSSLCIQFEDVVQTEMRQIDELIKVEILSNRILRSIKIAEDELENLSNLVEEHEAKHDKKELMEDDDVFEERFELLRNLIRTVAAQSGMMSNDYQKLLDSKNKILGELNARRRDRVDQINKSDETFFELVRSLKDASVRESQGERMELVRLAREKVTNEWRQPNTYPDGDDDCILLDDQSELPQRKGMVDVLIEEQEERDEQDKE